MMIPRIVALLLAFALSVSSIDYSGTDVLILTADNFEEEISRASGLLVEFYAPWCGHCKTLAPEWIQAAADLQGVAQLAAVDATQNGPLAERFGVQGYPTIKFFPPGDDTPVEYSGPRHAAGIVEWMHAKLEEYGVAPVLEETISPSTFGSCLAKKMCVVAVLPHLIDGGVAARNAYLDTVQQVAKNFRGKPLHFTWMQAGRQPKFETAFDLGGSGYPSLVAISKSKLRFLVHRRAFTVKDLTSTLKSLISGRGLPTVAFAALPDIATTHPWDGQEYTPEVEEEY
eukprot:NODE_3292_length_994_cov_55.693195_g3146_i0.p1 GENE.NODE_3292_length_994_cov_55.693195_g3146_i0~~NODE_3292_length_994_cov_55.693195_g3146_i0.p1  ORF type:complete len:304 (+),score=55.67 NODE_3292_length_994_cov_55.693195_g3146_i0:59-913(+)